MIQFVDDSPQKIINKMITDAETVLKDTLLPGDERNMFLQVVAQEIVGLKASINDTANQNLLKNASGAVLDDYGEQYDVARLAPDKATVGLAFTIPVALSYDITVPAGTRVTPDGVLNFIVDAPCIILQGTKSIMATATAEKSGVAYNGFLPGQIQSIVDPIINVSSVSNTSTSSGGTDTETDESYRQRMGLSWGKSNTTGCEDAYRYWARSASNTIADVAVESPSAGAVKLYVLTKDAQPASAQLLNDVLAVVGADKRRPITDHVTAVTAVVKSYTIALTYYISKSDGAAESKIQAEVQQAVEAFKRSQSSQLGGCINPDALRSLILAAGGFRLDITAPVYTALLQGEVATCATTTMTYGGLL